MARPKWIYWTVTGLIALVYYWGEATGYLLPAVVIILPASLWVIWNLNPDKPS